jgi:hypothetical protein
MQNYTSDQIEILNLISKEQIELLEKQAEQEEYFTAYEHGLNLF